MGRNFQTPIAAPRLPISVGSTTSYGATEAGAIAWSTTLLSIVEWNGTSWQLPGGDAPRSDFDFSPQLTSPALVGNVSRAYVQQIAGRDVFALRHGLFRNLDFVETAGWSTLKRSWIANNNTTAPSLNGLANNATAATTTFDAHSITFATAATAGSSAGTRHGSGICYLGNSGTTGVPIDHFYATRFKCGSFPERLFVGLALTGAVLGNADPSSNASIVGLCKDASDTSLSFVFRGTSGSAVKYAIPGIPLWSTLGSARYIDLAIWYPRAASTNENVGIAVRWTSLGSMHMGNDWVSQIHPIGSSINVAWGPQLWVNNGASAAARNISVNWQYMEQT